LGTPLTKQSRWAYIKLVLCALFWGGTFIAGRMTAQSVPHMTIATGRFIVASVILLIVAYRVEGGLPKLTRNQFFSTLTLGLTGISIYNVFFLAALERMPAGKTALLVAMSPILTGISVTIILKERLGWHRWGGLILAFIGVITIVTKGDVLHATQSIISAFGWGELFMMTAIVSWVAYTLISRFALKGLSPIAATTYATLFGTVFLLIGAAFEIPLLTTDMLTWKNTGAIFYLGSFGSALAFIWYSEGVKTIGPARTVAFTNLVPVFGVLLGYLVLSEPILLSMVIGGGIVIAGVTLTNRAKK
jgi:drug/metabolite transporter (DMT)-like permease